MSGPWRPVTSSEVKEWRKQLPKGWQRETAVIRSNSPSTAQHEGDTAYVDAPAKPKPMEGRAAVEAVVRDMLAWLQSGDREAVLARARQVKQAGGMGHLTDEEVASQLVQLAEKLARESVERVYAKEGRNRAAVLDGRAL